MKRILYNLQYTFDYYLGYFLYNKGKTGDHWRNYMFNRYPDKFKNEIEYLKEKEQK